MKLKEFLENPTELALHIKRKYVPIAEKNMAAEVVARVAYFDKEGNFRQNLVHKYVWERIMLLDLYTDLERSDNMVADFDAANEAELFEKIKAALPRREFEEWKAIVDMACENVLRNEYETESFIRRQVERFGQLAGVGLENLDADKIVAALKEIVEK